MFKIVAVLNSNRGSASVMWLAFVPVIVLMLIFLANLTTAGMTHASTNKAAEAGAIAAINKLDKWLLQEVADDIDYPEGVSVANLSTKEKLEFADQSKLKELANIFVSEHEDQLTSVIREYVGKNGGDITEGTVVLPVHNEHIQVKSRSEYEPFAFEALFQDEYIDGEGLSPGRDYLTSMNHREINY